MSEPKSALGRRRQRGAHGLGSQHKVAVRAWHGRPGGRLRETKRAPGTGCTHPPTQRRTGRAARGDQHRGEAGGAPEQRGKSERGMRATRHARAASARGLPRRAARRRPPPRVQRGPPVAAQSLKMCPGSSCGCMSLDTHCGRVRGGDALRTACRGARAAAAGAAGGGTGPHLEARGRVLVPHRGQRRGEARAAEEDPEPPGAVGELGGGVLGVVGQRGRPGVPLERVEGQQHGGRRDLARLRQGGGAWAMTRPLRQGRTMPKRGHRDPNPSRRSPEFGHIALPLQLRNLAPSPTPPPSRLPFCAKSPSPPSPHREAQHLVVHKRQLAQVGRQVL